jgi:hypothetical protein
MIGIVIGLLTGSLLMGNGHLFGQNPTYYDDIRPILVRHCIRCHDGSGYAPFPLTNYNDVAKRGGFIKHVVESRVMPPWPADPGYREFQNQNILSQSDIQAMVQWIEQGMMEGNAKQDSLFRSNVLVEPDTVWSFSMHRSYNMLPTSKDVFMRFHIPSEINRDIHVSRYEFIPGNLGVLHHSEVFIDSSATLNVSFDRDSSYHTPHTGYEAGDTSLQAYLYTTGWLPGERYEDYPLGVYGVIPEGSNMLFLNHYAPTPVAQSDSSVLRVHERRCNDCRRFTTVALHGHRHLTSGRFIIPADTVVTLHARRRVEDSLSAFAVLAHAHHLAREMRAYAVKPDGDTIALLHIPDWDFNWQFIYKFKEYEIVPKGSVIHFLVTYDNTAANPENPNSPPADVQYSFDADKEMMEFFLFGVPYRDGDEGARVIYPDTGF